jgi:hypothetical protein
MTANDTLPMQIHAPASRVAAGPDQVAVADTEMMPAVRFESAPPSMPPPTMRTMKQMKPKGFVAFPAITAGLLSTAAAWLGLALVLIAVAYPMGDLARASLTLIGSSLLAVVIAFAMSSRTEYA